MKIKYIVAVAALLCFVVLITSVFYVNSTKIKANGTVTEYKTFLAEKANQIQLRTTVDSNKGVRFSDEDLMEMWTKFFESAKFTYIKKNDNSVTNGGKKTVDFLSADNTISFQFIEDNNLSYIIIDNMVFSVKSNTAFPFDETYTIASERNRIINF